MKKWINNKYKNELVKYIESSEYWDFFNYWIDKFSEVKLDTSFFIELTTLEGNIKDKFFELGKYYFEILFNSK